MTLGKPGKKTEVKLLMNNFASFPKTTQKHIHDLILAN